MTRCVTGKVIHCTRTAAQKALGNARLNQGGSERSIYFCATCGYFHLTSLTRMYGDGTRTRG